MKWVDTEKWNEIFISISKHKLRTALTALGVFWGIFMLVILLGAGQGLQNGIAQQFRSDAINSLWIYGGSTSLEFNGLPKNRRIIFNNDDYLEISNRFPEVPYLAGRVYLSNNLILKYKDKSLGYSVRAIHPDMRHIENINITKGRFINEKDQRDIRKVAVIGEIVRQDVFGGENPIGKEIMLGSTAYYVIGVSFDAESDRAQREILIPISVGQVVYQGNENISNLGLVTGDMNEGEVQALEEGIIDILAANHQFNPADERAIRVNNRYEDYKNVQNLFFGIKAFLWFVGVGSILAGIVGVSNIMLIIVKDRTKEIGVRKALGATPQSIISMVLSEAIFITFMAGYMGFFFGVVVLYLISGVDSDFFRNPEIHLGVGFAAVLILVIAGTLAGLIPARQAAKINPIEAMRS
ncbi:ABC transporter permease [Membranicola marinus]|uniref:ABC transporter permease n=1 Tax=Membranihabitans marinus TaxID=1227546 RepID=A0A953LA57_9BACT|nr:ABC transporter permease [Membranihabitans marinus]MBY5958348.1 ABC transporter permease [Membranihabitans marinus]